MLNIKNNTHPLQSPEWADFRKRWGNEVVEIEKYNLTLHRIPFTPYRIGAFIKGPKPTQELLDKLKKLGQEKNLIFVKLEPNFPATIDGVETEPGEKNNLIKRIRKNGGVAGKTLFTPSTFWIDLAKSEGDLLRDFSSKTRYNIRVAQKNGVEIAEDDSDQAFQRYLELTAETTKRQNFYAHSKKYHELMWQVLHKEMVEKGEAPIARLITAKYQGEIITTWILFVYDNFLYYPYGASTDKYKNVMANNLMMWEAIKYGQKHNCKIFDLWGREPGKGFTKFKEGYHPMMVEFLGTWDLVFNKPIYYIYRIAEGIRWFALRNLVKLGLSKSRL